MQISGRQQQALSTMFEFKTTHAAFLMVTRFPVPPAESHDAPTTVLHGSNGATWVLGRVGVSHFTKSLNSQDHLIVQTLSFCFQKTPGMSLLSPDVHCSQAHIHVSDHHQFGKLPWSGSVWAMATCFPFCYNSSLFEGHCWSVIPFSSFHSPKTSFWSFFTSGPNPTPTCEASSLHSSSRTFLFSIQVELIKWQTILHSKPMQVHFWDVFRIL